MAALIPQSKVDDFVVNFESGGEVVEDGGFVLFGELIFGIAVCEGCYLTRMQVLPMAPSPTMTSLTGIGSDYIAIYTATIAVHNTGIMPAHMIAYLHYMRIQTKQDHYSAHSFTHSILKTGLYSRLYSCTRRRWS